MADEDRVEGSMKNVKGNVKETAELKREQVLAYGPDPRMSISKGPLGCYIEPAPTD